MDYCILNYAPIILVSGNYIIIQALTVKFLIVQANGRELHFSMVDGDFKKFEGKWSVKSGRR